MHIDISDYMDELSDEDIEREFRDRKLHIKSGTPEIDLDDEIQDAYNALLCNQPAEARAILERVLYPKWRSPAACEAELKRSQTDLI